ncbi:uncharacterized protein LOC126176383 [Schistocerca cancellata]|uniref:uncharacterized protein LOC126176383 n=1 Tax=Schistocerca cancellata TaxID=274614 RepID=UPI002118DC9F|nr:uncharacterized protein LOC126176383 [Schistocerca cancellata]
MDDSVVEAPVCTPSEVQPSLHAPDAVPMDVEQQLSQHRSSTADMTPPSDSTGTPPDAHHSRSFACQPAGAWLEGPTATARYIYRRRTWLRHLLLSLDNNSHHNMYKLVILMCAVAAAHAGYLGGYAAPAVAVAAPAVAVAHAPVAVAPAASSYANTYRVSQTARLLAAPAVAAAPVAYAAPAIHAPLAYAAPAVAAPLLKVH